MDEFPDQITRAAEKAVATCEEQRGGRLDYSEVSLAIVEEVLSEVHRRLA